MRSLTSALVLSLTACGDAPIEAVAPAEAAPSAKTTWCNGDTIFTSPSIVWDGADVAAMVAAYGVTGADDADLAAGAAESFCADQYSAASLTADGVPLNFSGGSSAQTGDAGMLWVFNYPGGEYLPPGYTLDDGITFSCEMCGYHKRPTRPDLDWLDLDGLEPAQGKGKGMTWLQKDVDPVSGVTTVGCDNGDVCDAVNGDTECDIELPLLCALDAGLPAPTTLVDAGLYYTWAGTVVATSAPVAPSIDGISTLSQADAVCEAEFGAGWRTAEFHDGWGWNFVAYGNVGDEPRFWVNIDDQANGTCWTQ